MFACVLRFLSTSMTGDAWGCAPGMRIDKFWTHSGHVQFCARIRM